MKHSGFPCTSYPFMHMNIIKMLSFTSTKYPKVLVVSFENCCIKRIYVIVVVALWSQLSCNGDNIFTKLTTGVNCNCYYTNY